MRSVLELVKKYSKPLIITFGSAAIAFISYIVGRVMREVKGRKLSITEQIDFLNKDINSLKIELVKNDLDEIDTKINELLIVKLKKELEKLKRRR